MDSAGVISVARTLPIDGALLDDVMLRLRRDSAPPSLCWTLGRLGAAEVDTRFTSTGPSWTTEARLWNHDGLAVAAATLHLEASGADEVRLTLEPVLPVAPAQGLNEAELLDLARAAVDELAEEILWHATRAGLTNRS
ncbi:MAG TPA: hypothetical protein VIK54_08585 [Acidimicrobiia bacterium]